MQKDTQSRKWQITINNPTEKGFTHDKIKELIDTFKKDYWCMCDEIGEKGTYHTHLFIYYHNGIRFSVIKNRFEGAHIEMANGTSQQNRDYIRKEGKWEKDKKKETNIIDTFEEFGEIPVERQGARNDLEDLYSMIKQGMTNSEILEQNAENLMRLDKIDKARMTYLGGLYRKTRRLDLEVIYICGKTGTGKTRDIMDDYGDENVYRITDYDHPFDNYECQDIVVFEEFRSSLKIQDMLNYLDVYPLQLPCRYSNKIACFTKVFIVSNWLLTEQFDQVQKSHPETYKAFLRRIHQVKVYDGETKVQTSTTEYLHNLHQEKQSKLDQYSFEDIINYCHTYPTRESLDLGHSFLSIS